MAMAAINCAVEQQFMIPGQFDDAEEEEEQLRLLQQSQPSQPSTAITADDKGRPTNVHSIVASSQKEKEEIDDDKQYLLDKEDEDEDDDDDDDDDYYYDYDDDDVLGINGGGGGGSGGMNQSSAGAAKRMNLSHSVANSVAKMQEMEISAKRTLSIGRDDRATMEQVLDPRTRLILFKLLSRGFLQVIDGCLSTGKEANVYYAKAGNKMNSIVSSKNSSNNNNNKVKKQQQKEKDDANIQDDATLAEAAAPAAADTSLSDNDDKVNYNTVVVTEYAIKIYKTSILVFKDRDKYVSGEHRWRKGYCKSNPRKMIKVWAEKEMRNYKRIYTAGIPCPQPILLKSHVLVMEFLGTDGGWPSPRLKDANLSENKLRQAYVECILIMRHLYQKCRLVHGDLSEYNLLWHKNQIYVIDVSQSVETDHPSALDFLRKDASNINDYFRKVGRLPVMTVRQLFEFVTTPLSSSTTSSSSSSGGNGTSNKEEHYDETVAELAALDAIMNHVQESEAQLSSQTEEGRREAQQQEDVDEAVFMSSFLPRSLNQMAEHDVQQLQDGQVEETYAIAVAALTGNADVVQAVQQAQQQQQQHYTAKSKSTSTQTVQSLMTNMNDATAADTKMVTFAQDKDASGSPTSDIENEDDNSNNNDNHNDSNDDDESGDSVSDDDEEEDEDDSAFGKVPRTPEELQSEREAKRTERKVNKKAVKEAKSDKRKDKIKKKDKRRAIKKSKAGNRKK